MAETGDVLSDRYELRSRIGRGGMAGVFRARDRRLRRDVAVKVLATHLLDDPSAARRLQREARAAAALAHPGIVAVHDTGADDGVHYIVMELVEGPSLAEVIAAEGPLAPDRSAGIIREVAEAVGAAHQRGIVHRDLKPSNVLFDPDGRARITDFGIAHLTGATTTQTVTLAGSAPYLAPEQARGEVPAPPADVYGMGCILVEMLTGEPPFGGATPAAVIAAHLEQPPPVPSRLRPEVPARLDRLAARMLAKDPADRPADAGALLDLLDTVAAGGTSAPAAATARLEEAPTTPLQGSARSGVTRPVPGDAGPVPTRSRWRWAAALAAAVAVVAVVLALGPLSGDGAPAASGRPTTSPSPTASPTASPTSSPTASPSPTPSPSPPPPTAAAAAADLRAAIEQARREFRLPEKAAEDLDKKVVEVIDRHRDDKAEQARKKLDELAEKLDELAEKDEIDAATHEHLAEHLAALAGAL